PAAAARRDLDRALHRCRIPLRTRHAIRRLLRDARHRARSRSVLPEADRPVERRCPRRPHRGRLPHLPRSPLADRRAWGLRPWCLMAGRRGGRLAGHVARNRWSESGDAGASDEAERRIAPLGPAYIELAAARPTRRDAGLAEQPETASARGR